MKLHYLSSLSLSKERDVVTASRYVQGSESWEDSHQLCICLKVTSSTSVFGDDGTVLVAPSSQFSPALFHFSIALVEQALWNMKVAAFIFGQLFPM